jgi:hypothetical protein
MFSSKAPPERRAAGEPGGCMCVKSSTLRTYCAYCMLRSVKGSTCQVAARCGSPPAGCRLRARQVATRQAAARCVPSLQAACVLRALDLGAWLRAAQHGARMHLACTLCTAHAACSAARQGASLHAPKPAACAAPPVMPPGRSMAKPWRSAHSSVAANVAFWIPGGSFEAWAGLACCRAPRATYQNSRPQVAELRSSIDIAHSCRVFRLTDSR